LTQCTKSPASPLTIECFMNSNPRPAPVELDVVWQVTAIRIVFKATLMESERALDLRMISTTARTRQNYGVRHKDRKVDIYDFGESIVGAVKSI